ncbi:isochorismate synthase [Microbacterium sp. NPDC076895]|uniref:isochorismate synthase n=1 Tax=Microbacterium sp. NPDC076895 TaxID=3154957 RepID=UPI003415DF2E
MTRNPPLPPLVVETREIEPVADLLSLTDPLNPLAWLRRGEGIVGSGSAVVTIGGPGAPPLSRPIAEVWRELVSHARISDPLQLPGTGLVGFGALGFDPDSAEPPFLVVPQAITGVHGVRAWVTTIRHEGEPELEQPTSVPYGPHWSATLGPGLLDPDGYRQAVRSGIEAITAGEVEKVVLSRDLVGTIPAGADLRRLVRALATSYPDTWTFAVDGLIGASPETLITVDRGAVTARVLAGTTARGADAAEDAAAAHALEASRKDLDEHRFAVMSVVDALTPLTRDLVAPDQPHLLELPNLWHLATDIAGRLSNGASALDLVRVLHPTAAVAGTPTDAALDVIRRLEPFDRGRYAGPVGWIDARGDGEWAIALRCAQIGGGPQHDAADSDTIPVVAHAGAGIVSASDPETELLETRVKFRPIVDALT